MSGTSTNPKPKIIVWGGFLTERDTPLSLDELNSHASVTCYFLSAALREHFNVVQISSFLGAENILEHGDAVAVLSTFQAGFTRLFEKNSRLFNEIKQTFSGKLTSIVDFISFQHYAEDILFTVLPSNNSAKERIKRVRARAKIVHMGWCADPIHCSPGTKENEFTIFLDHGNYAGEDYSGEILEACNRLAKEKDLKPFTILYQGNSGIEFFTPGDKWHGERYIRAQKTSWQEIQKNYSKIDVFCVTHRESAGLGVIEAAMSGAHILVPNIETPFIRTELLNSGVPHTIVECEADAIATALAQIMASGVDRKANHAQLTLTHGWDRAAINIARTLENNR